MINREKRKVLAIETRINPTNNQLGKLLRKTINHYSLAMKNITVPSYTHAMVNGLQLHNYFNFDCGRVLQFGASNGAFLQDCKGMGWEVTGYEYSTSAILRLQSQGINAKQVDLNTLDSSGNLSYEDELKHDLINPTNIFLVRILQYLDLSAFNALLFFLIENAAVGSVFVIGDTIVDQESNQANLKYLFERVNLLNRAELNRPGIIAPSNKNKNQVPNFPPSLPQSMSTTSPLYKISFFAPRTDMKIELVQNVFFNDEVIVVTKIGQF